MNPAFPQDATWPDNDLLKFWQTPESDQSNNSGGEFGQGVQDNMRTIYFGNLPQHITLQLLLDHVNGGIVERVKLFVERRCAFVTFLHATEAARVFSDTQNRKIAIGGMETRVGWGNPITRAAHILQAANQGATRHVLIGNLDAEYLTVSALAAVFSAYGQLDTISIMPDTNVASVHFASIYSAIKAVGDLCSQHTWANCTITYGDDRCTIPVSDVSPPLLSNIALPNTEISRRTVYIGSIHPDAAVRDLCDVLLIDLGHSRWSAAKYPLPSVKKHCVCHVCRQPSC